MSAVFAQKFLYFSRWRTSLCRDAACRMKVRMQSLSTVYHTVGTQHSYNSINDGFRYERRLSSVCSIFSSLFSRSCRQVMKSEGWKGLWRGAPANMTRVGIGSAAQLAVSWIFGTNLLLILCEHFFFLSVLTTDLRHVQANDRRKRTHRRQRLGSHSIGVSIRRCNCVGHESIR